MIAIILPMILNFLGTAGIGSLTKILDHKKDLAIEAGKLKNDARRIQLEREIAQIQAEIDLKRLQADLGQTDRKYRLFRIGAHGLVVAVTGYWIARFVVRGLSLDADYAVVVSGLSAEEAVVSTMVLAYVFIKAR